MDISENVQLALIVAVPSVLSPLLVAFLAHLFGRRQRLDEAAARIAEKQTDWKRQDEVAAKLLAQQELTAARAADAATHAAAALAVAKETAVKIDGMLVDRDKASEAKGAASEAERGKHTAVTLREGQLQGRADEKASRGDLSASSDAPISVADKPTQDATERSAVALERTADAAEIAAGRR